MSAQVLRFAIVLTRAWLRVYTSHAPRVVAHARCGEIESDLWEMLHDLELGSDSRRAWIACSRLCRGIPDDLAWAGEHLPMDEQLLVRRILALTAATVMVVALWTAPAWLNGRREVDSCAAASPAPATTADLRYQVMRCAGAFFLSSR